VTVQGPPPAFPPAVESRIQGWRLVWAELESVPADAPALRSAFDEEVARLADAWRDRVLTDDSTVAEVRRLFRAVGCDPTRYRPSSEALLRRLQRDGVPSTGVPVVDVNNLLSMRLRMPCCVIDPLAVEPPLTLRAGIAGESMAAMRGLMGLADKLVLADRRGPFGTPISDAERVKVSPDSPTVWMVVYMPAQGADEVDLEAEITRLLTLMPAARLLAIA
jgi:DNA/RNA-binding domain of Phe-tRNA-synthetase-like protein